MNYRIFFVLILTMFNYSFMAGMERDEEKQIDCIRTFLDFNAQYHITRQIGCYLVNATELMVSDKLLAHLSDEAKENQLKKLAFFVNKHPYLYNRTLPEMPNVHETIKNISDAGKNGYIDAYEGRSILFLDQLEACKHYVGNNATYLQGIEELKVKCVQALGYVNKIKSELILFQQVKLHTQLIEAVKTAALDDARELLFQQFKLDAQLIEVVKKSGHDRRKLVSQQVKLHAQLIEAVETTSVDNVRQLLSQQVKLNAPLIEAVATASIHDTTELVPQQFTLNAQLIKAIETASVHTMRELLSRGASANSRDVFTGDTALMKAIKNLKIEPFDYLLSHKDVDPNLEMYDITQSRSAKTPLTEIAHKMMQLDPKKSAARAEEYALLTSIVCALIRKGADPDKVDGHGETFNQLMPNFFNTVKTEHQMPQLVP